MEIQYAQLREEYEKLWRTMEVRPSREAIANRIATTSIANRARYRIVEARTGVPWYWVAAAHSLESGQRFSTHLHNGDPLSDRTVHVPGGRPKTGSPPFDWTESAVDAVTMPPHSLHTIREWSIERCLYELERYNGWGYRLFHPNVLSPYLWSFTNQYTSGKYVADGRWSSSHVSTQCGAAAILRSIFTLDEAAGNRISAVDEATFDMSVKSMQEYLNALGAEPELVADGIFGPKTRAAVMSFQGNNGLVVDGIVGPKTWAMLKMKISNDTRS